MSIKLTYEIDVKHIGIFKISSDGYLIISENSSIKVFDMAMGEFIHEFKENKTDAFQLIISEDCENILSVDKNNILFVWKKRTGEIILGSIKDCIKYTIYKKYVLILRNNGKLYKYDINSKSIILETKLVNFSNSLTYQNMNKLYVINDNIIIRMAYIIESYKVDTFQSVYSMEFVIGPNSILYEDKIIVLISDESFEFCLNIYNLNNMEKIYEYTSNTLNTISLSWSNLILYYDLTRRYDYDDDEYNTDYEYSDSEHESDIAHDEVFMLNLQTLDLININDIQRQIDSKSKCIISIENIIIFTDNKFDDLNGGKITWYNISTKQVIYQLINSKYIHHTNDKIVVTNDNNDIVIYDILTAKDLYILQNPFKSIYFCDYFTKYPDDSNFIAMHGYSIDKPRIAIWSKHSGSRTKAALHY